MKSSVAAIALLFLFATSAFCRSYNPCAVATRAQPLKEFCGSNGEIYPNRHAFNCARLSDSRLRRVSCGAAKFGSTGGMMMDDDFSSEEFITYT